MIVKFTRTNEQAMAPTQFHAGDAGWDLYVSRGAIIPPRSFMDVHTDVAAALPLTLWGRITGRSSTHRKHGLMVAEGIVDNGYRGELFVGVWNMNDHPVEVTPGMRVAQFILHSLIDVNWLEVEQLPPSSRGESGFGSTGV